MKITERDENTITSALRVAAEVYENDAKAVEDTAEPGAAGEGGRSLARQFRAQALQARSLAERIEVEGLAS